MLSTLGVYVAAMRRKRAAMESLQETGDRLLQSISRGDTAPLGDILNARAAACVELGRAFSAGSSSDFDLSRLACSELAEVREAAAEIMEDQRRIESLRERTLAAQSECETALRAALAETARQLRETAGHKKVRSAYRAQSPGPPRFLDSKK
jgi:hypothetical protein